MLHLWHMRFLAVSFVLLLGATGNGGGCSNPNAIGVQQYGTIVGRVLDATDNRPVPNALIYVGSLYTAYSDATGAFTLTQIPIGHQPVTASSPGYERHRITATVHQNETTNVGYIRILPVTGGPTAPPPPVPAGPTPIPTPVPALPATAPPSPDASAPSPSPSPSSAPTASP